MGPSLYLTLRPTVVVKILYTRLDATVRAEVLHHCNRLDGQDTIFHIHFNTTILVGLVSVVSGRAEQAKGDSQLTVITLGKKRKREE